MTELAAGSRAAPFSIARASIAGLVALIASGALIGWLFDVRALKSVVPGLTTMKANTGIGLVAGAIALACLDAGRRRRAGAVVAAAVMVVLGTLTLFEYGAGVQLGIDQLLFIDPETTSRPFNGRMSPVTALGLLGCGTSLVLLAVGRGRRAINAAHLLAAIPAAGGLVSLTGYAYGVERLYNFGPYMSVAVHTGMALALLAGGIVLTRHEEGWAAPFDNNPIAMAALLRIGVLALVVPVVTGLLVVRGVRAGFYQAMFAPTLLAIGAAGALLWLAFRSAHILAASEADVRRARQESLYRATELARTRQRHEALLDGLPQLVWTCLPDGNCNYLSRQWVEYTGIPEAEQLGLAWLGRIDPRDVERTAEHWRGALAGR